MLSVLRPSSTPHTYQGIYDSDINTFASAQQILLVSAAQIMSEKNMNVTRLDSGGDGGEVCASSEEGDSDNNNDNGDKPNDPQTPLPTITHDTNRDLDHDSMTVSHLYPSDTYHPTEPGVHSPNPLLRTPTPFDPSQVDTIGANVSDEKVQVPFDLCTISEQPDQESQLEGEPIPVPVLLSNQCTDPDRLIRLRDSQAGGGLESVQEVDEVEEVPGEFVNEEEDEELEDEVVALYGERIRRHSQPQPEGFWRGYSDFGGIPTGPPACLTYRDTVWSR